MEKIAFRMRLKAGHLDEYRRRHDEIWPDLVTLLKEAGIVDYSIHYAKDTCDLFAVLWRKDGHSMDELPNHPVMQRWWAHMADLMETLPNNEPVVEPLETAFYLP